MGQHSSRDLFCDVLPLRTKVHAIPDAAPTKANRGNRHAFLAGISCVPLKLFVDFTLTCTKGLQSFLFLITCYNTDSIVQHSSNHPLLKAQYIRQPRPHLRGIDSCFLFKTPLESILWDAIISRVVQKYRTSRCWGDIGRCLHAERIETDESQL